MNATQDKIHQALVLLKQLTEDVEKKSSRLDPVYEELATSFACLCRARRLLNERPDDAVVPA